MYDVVDWRSRRKKPLSLYLTQDTCGNALPVGKNLFERCMDVLASDELNLSQRDVYRLTAKVLAVVEGNSHGRG
jgi:hypothetical protein